MKTILRNFLSVLKRFRVATILNILGLTIAFAAFILLMIQASYDLSYNRTIEDGDKVARLEFYRQAGSSQAIINRPLAEMLIGSSPHIQAVGIIQGYDGESVFEVDHNGYKAMFKEPSQNISPGFTEVFPFIMIEGIAEAVHEPDKVLLPESVARKLFGNEHAVNKVLKFGETSRTIGGVYKDFPENSSLKNVIYTPLGDENKENWGNSNYNIYVKFDNLDFKEEVAESFMRNQYAERRRVSNPDYEYDATETIRFTPFEDLHFVKNVEWDVVEKSSEQTVAILIAIAFILVIIAGINFTNFSMALTPMRVKSINTQKVMGADVGMLRKALLMEAFTICFVSFGLSLGIVWIFSATGLSSLISGTISLNSHINLVFLTLLIACAVALFAGLYPAYYVTSFPPALVLKGNFGLSSKGRALRNFLIGFQYVSSFALIIGASFMYLQNHYMQNSALGYDRDALIVTTLNGTINQNRNAFGNELKSFSGIENVTYSQFLLSSSDRYMGWGRMYRDKYIDFQCLPVDTSFLTVMNIPVLEGRNFRPEDANTKYGAFIFNQKAKYDYEMELGENIDGMEIVGFMPDVNFASFRMDMEPMAFYLWGTENWGIGPNFAYVKVNAGSNFRDAFQHVRQTLAKFDDGYPFETFFFDDVLQRTYEKERKMTLMITLFSLMAIFISIVGVFGLVIFESQYRIKEIGIRKVMGSSTKEIILMFNKIYLRILIICFILAAPMGYYAVKNWLENFAYRTPMYWWIFLLAFIVVGVITVITVTFQNWRAASTNPVESIKAE